MGSALPASEFICNDDGSIYHLALKPGELAHNIIFVGDPDRVSIVSRQFDTIELTRQRREFVTHTGVYNNKRFSVISTGIGTDNVDIVLNEVDALFNIDFKTRMLKSNVTALNCVRIGTCGGLQPYTLTDSFIASKSSIGFDGLMHCYKVDYTARETALTEAITQHCHGFANQKLLPYVTDGAPSLLDLFSHTCTVGLTATCSGFYGPQGRQLRLKAQMPDFLDQITDFTFDTERITNFEMETAGLYGLGKALGHRCLSLSVVVANRTTGQFSENPDKAMSSLIELTLDTLSR